jgi:hypothetical protein
MIITCTIELDFSCFGSFLVQVDAHLITNYTTLENQELSSTSQTLPRELFIYKPNQFSLLLMSLTERRWQHDYVKLLSKWRLEV